MNARNEHRLASALLLCSELEGGKCLSYLLVISHQKGSEKLSQLSNIKKLQKQIFFFCAHRLGQWQSELLMW